MEASRALKVALVVALIAFMGATVGRAGAAQSTPGVDIGLGFGPGSVIPVSAGVPIYTTGDQIWAESYYNSSSLYITLLPPGGSSGPATFLGPNQLSRLYTLAPGDPTGNWTMEVFNSYPGTISQLTFSVENSSSNLQAGFVSALAQSNEVALQYSVPPTGAYDIQACSMGKTAPSMVSFTLPGSIGGGIGVSLGNGTAVFTAPGAVAPFTGWLELYTNRAYANGTSLVSESVLAAKTEALSLGAGNGTTTAALEELLNLRDGRYDLRTFIRGPSGLGVYETPLLLEGGSRWISLAGCTQLVGVTSNSFSLSTNLDSANSTWPRSMFLMYTVHGIDSFTEQGVPVSEGRIDVRTTSGLRLTGATLGLSADGVQSWSSHNSNVYFVGTRSSNNVSVSVDFGVTSETFNLAPPGAFDTSGLAVSAGFLTVATEVNGAPLVNATVTISAQGKSVQSSSGIFANETVMLPPGAYNVSVSGAGGSASAQANVLAGSTTAISLDVSPPKSDLPAYVLAGVLLVFAGLNFVVWRGYIERRRVMR